MEEPIKEDRPNKQPSLQEPTPAFIGITWVALLTGIVSYNVGLYNAEMELNEKGYYFTLLLFGLFAVITVQKNVRDRMEGMEISDIYYGISWAGASISVVLLVIGLWNADLLLSEKGFFGMSYLLGLYAAIVVGKNVRDSQGVKS